MTSRAAFSLVEVVVAVAILAILAAAIYPVAVGRWRQGQAAALGAQLDALRQAIATYERDVQRHPATLSQLASPLAAGADDACGGNVPALLRARWRGPYVNRPIAGNLMAGDATILDALGRVPPTTASTPVGELRITATDVDSGVAVLLEREYDAAFDFSAGALRWMATSPSIGTLVFAMPIRGC